MKIWVDDVRPAPETNDLNEKLKIASEKIYDSAKKYQPYPTVEELFGMLKEFSADTLADTEGKKSVQKGLIMIKIDIERWKWNPDFELYVSNKGHFMTRDKRLTPLITCKGGYLKVYCYGITNKMVFAHRAVLLTWRPNSDAENLTVDHLDHNKRNNALSNLEWVTQEENVRRAAADYAKVEEGNAEAIVYEENPYEPYVKIDGINFNKAQYQKMAEMRYAGDKRRNRLFSQPMQEKEYTFADPTGKLVRVISYVCQEEECNSELASNI